MNYVATIILSIGGIVLTIGDIVMKKWVNTDKISTFIIGILIYVVGLIFLAFSFKYENIAVASAFFVIFNIITLSLVSWLYFHEPLSTYQIIGIVLSLFLLAYLELTC